MEVINFFAFLPLYNQFVSELNFSSDKIVIFNEISESKSHPLDDYADRLNIQIRMFIIRIYRLIEMYIMPPRLMHPMHTPTPIIAKLYTDDTKWPVQLAPKGMRNAGSQFTRWISHVINHYSNRIITPIVPGIKLWCIHCSFLQVRNCIRARIVCNLIIWLESWGIRMTLDYRDYVNYIYTRTRSVP